MKAALAVAAVLLQSLSPVLAQVGGTWDDNLRRPPGWKLIRTVDLLTGTDNGGEMQAFSSGASRRIRVVIGLSNALVATDYVFRRRKLASVSITRTYFSLGADGIDFTRPSSIQNGRYGFRDGKLISRVTRERSVGGRWKYSVEVMDKLDPRREVEDARYFLHVAASGRRVDVEPWLSRRK